LPYWSTAVTLTLVPPPAVTVSAIRTVKFARGPAVAVAEKLIGDPASPVPVASAVLFPVTVPRVSVDEAGSLPTGGGRVQGEL